MAKLCINDKIKCNGTMDFSLIETEKGSVECHGRLMTHRYIEELKSIETDRYILGKIHVYKESFASGDYNIMYEFRAGRWSIDPVMEHLTDEARIKIENELYAFEEEELFHKYIQERKDMNE